MKPKIINLHIDRIVMDGVAHLNHGQLSLAIETELHRLISVQGLHNSLYQSGAINKIAANPITLNSPVREKSLGNKIAGSVYRGMKL
jgi:hypothetical protein